MKTLRGRHKDGYVVIKLFIKPESGMSLTKQVKKFNGKLIEPVKRYELQR
jgi:hypothetical protein